MVTHFISILVHRLAYCTSIKLRKASLSRIDETHQKPPLVSVKRKKGGKKVIYRTHS